MFIIYYKYLYKEQYFAGGYYLLYFYKEQYLTNVYCIS